MLANGRAEIEAVLCISDVVRPGVVSLDGKWWDRPSDTSAVTNLLSDSRQTPKGQPMYNDTFVFVRPRTV